VVRSQHFGTYLMMEVGALMVGKIVNHHTGYTRLDVMRGQEKGYFAFGGSTIVLLFMPGAVELDEPILQASAHGEEIRVRMGQRIGRAARRQ
jgi:phosphatidylserine decarboxylase